MSPSPLASLGWAAVHFLVMVQSQGPETGRLEREWAERKSLLFQDPWKAEAAWNWTARGGMQTWNPSWRLEGRLGPLLWGTTAAVEVTCPSGEGESSLAYSHKGWVFLPLQGLMEGGNPDPVREEIRRMDRQLALDRNSVVLKALDLHGAWASALEEAEVFRERSEALQSFFEGRKKNLTEVDPLLLLKKEADYQEAQFRFTAAVQRSEIAEQACFLWGGGGCIPPPQPWQWMEQAPLPLPESSGSDLKMDVLTASLNRDAALEYRERQTTGAGLKLWTAGGGTFSLGSDEKGWKENPRPWENLVPFSAGVDLVFPLHTPESERSSELHSLILQGQAAAERQYGEETLRNLQITRNEWSLRKRQTGYLEILWRKTSALWESGEASREDRDIAYFHYRESLLRWGDLQRKLNLQVMELWGRKEDLSHWLEKEADHESAVCNP